MSERRREILMKALVIHLVVYIMVNALLAAINYMFSPGILWFLYALIPWGIGLVIHFLVTFLWRDGEARSKTSARQRAFIVHLVFYLLVNGFLAAINLMFTPQVLWFIFPLIGWGIGIVLHLLFSFFWIPAKE
ncbi:MAG TPA: 2TM domain-containing protein [Bacillota bacterium]|nr:2TM domain-containing protein [Bacillota bacterium]